MSKKIIISIWIFICVSLMIFSQQTQTSEYEDLPITGNEIWNINNILYEIEGTSIVGRSLYVIKVLIDDLPSEKYENQATKIAQYSIKNDLYIMAGLNSINGKQIDLGNNIGIALIKKEKEGVFNKATGYRFHFLVNDLVDEMNSETPLLNFIDSDLKSFLDNFIKNYNSNSFQTLYDSFANSYKSQISFLSFNKSMENNKKVFNQALNTEYLYAIYLGTKGGIKGYNIYLKTTLKLQNIEKKGFVKLFFLETNESYQYMGGEWFVPAY